MMTVFVLFTLLLSVSAIGANDAAGPQIAGKPTDAQYPFVAEVTGADVYVRSGKGTAYYHCGKVQQGDPVTVFEEVFGWAKVLPPKGCYSWIHKDYVDVQNAQANVGVLNADSVRVWAGSDYIQPMRSSSMQTKLNSGEIVELTDDQPEGGDYYKIKPPTGAYLWVSCEFLKYTGPVQKPKPAAAKAPDAAPAQPVQPTQPAKPAVLEPSDLPPSTETGIPTFENVDEGEVAAAADKQPEQPKMATQSDISQAIEKAGAEKSGTQEADLLNACYALSTKIDQELQKPLTEQRYDNIRKTLESIQENDSAGKAATYAQILLERIARYELAISVINTLKEQDKTLAQTKEKIQQAHQTKLDDLPKEPDYIFTGTLKQSHVYTAKTGQQRYLILDSSGKILCYVVAGSEDASGQLKSLIGMRVGVQGTVSSDQNALKTLISASNVERLP
jgi:uncharacterized protein YgiM (DUF1202 family)